ncbi:MAG: NADH-quinone oxidoreductase subunit C [Candidatus Heimdallarchaeota archaeon]|nr:NADH-quinone oxidoreductase subunit C [Candidatus Heimdallarchaeota archaeon]
MMLNVPKSLDEVAKALNLTRRDPKIYPRDYYVNSSSDRMLEIAAKLKNEFGVHHVSTVIVRDDEDGFHLIYPFSVILDNSEWGKLIVDFLVDKKNPEVESLTPEFPGLVIAEREAYDMMGIRFKNHPDLRRLLTPDIMPSDIYPLRKDITAEEIRRRLAEEAEKRRLDLE